MQETPTDQPATSQSSAPPAPEPSGKKRGIRVPTWVRVAMSLGLLAFLAYQLNLTQMLSVLAGASPIWIAAGLALSVMAFFMLGYRWYLLLPSRLQHVRYLSLVRMSYIGAYVGMFLPGVVGMEAVKVTHLAVNTKDLASAFSSVMLDRILGLITLVLLVILGVVFSPVALDPIVIVLAFGALGAILTFVLAAMWPTSRAVLDRLLPGMVRVRVAKVYTVLDEYRARPGVLVWGLCFCLIYQMQRVVFVMVAAKALGIDVDLRYWAMVVPVVMFLQMLPLSISGLGVREFSMVYLLGLVGVPSEQAFALGVLIGLLTIIAALPGAWLLAHPPKKTTKPSEKPGDEPTEPAGESVKSDQMLPLTSDPCDDAAIGQSA